MKPKFMFLACGLAALAIAACAADTPEGAPVGSSESAAVSSIVSMTRRADGDFDVVCRGNPGESNRTEVVTEAALLRNDVCVPRPPPPPPPPPPGSRVVRGVDRSLDLGHGLNSAAAEEWGRGLWEGYLTLEARLEGSEALRLDNARLVDAAGGSYPLTTTATRFDRLPLPVSLLATTDGSVATRVRFTNVSYEVTRTNPIEAHTLAGRFDATADTAVRTIGADIPGVQLSFSAAARFYANFTNGNACARVTLVDGAGRVETLLPASPSRSVTMAAPITVRSQATCVSSRVASAENPNDFDVQVSAISLGDPR